MSRIVGVTYPKEKPAKPKKNESEKADPKKGE